jgi:hypothetical protein
LLFTAGAGPQQPVIPFRAAAQKAPTKPQCESKYLQMNLSYSDEARLRAIIFECAQIRNKTHPTRADRQRAAQLSAEVHRIKARHDRAGSGMGSGVRSSGDFYDRDPLSQGSGVVDFRCRDLR